MRANASGVPRRVVSIVGSGWPAHPGLSCCRSRGQGASGRVLRQDGYQAARRALRELARSGQCTHAADAHCERLKLPCAPTGRMLDDPGQPGLRRLLRSGVAHVIRCATRCQHRSLPCEGRVRKETADPVFQPIASCGALPAVAACRSPGRPGAVPCNYPTSADRRAATDGDR